MSVTKGTGTGAHPVDDTRPLMLLRYRSGLASQSARTVHLALLPTGGASEIRTLCGVLLPSDHVETLSPGEGMPCTGCLLSPRLPGDTPGSLRPQDDTDLPPQVLATRYQAWGWPVTLRGDHMWLSLGQDTVAVMIPVSLAVEVTAVLRQRRCPPPVLAHPDVPEHQVLLAGERYGIELPWPPGVHRVSETLSLPPTVTAHGPITWVHPPEPDALQLCREVDIVTALRTVLRDSSGVEHLQAGLPAGVEADMVRTSAAALRPTRDVWCDVDSNPIDLFCLVEQIAEDPEPTVLASWLHQHGQVIGRGSETLYVCFADHHVVSLRPDLLRVLDPAPGGD
ncbi:MAG: hypothetical protein ACRDRX_26505 [Pseudonocardiaceae bacterium]